jgi:CheY-like chemotaxis protein
MQLEGFKIVVMDVHRDSIDVLCALLAHEGAYARRADSMAEAVEACSQMTPDVLIVDPVSSDASAMLRQIRERRYIPAICFTSWVSREGRHSALRAGFDAFVAKPLVPVELTAKIQRLKGR